MTILDPGPPVTAAALDGLAARLGAPLPPALARFLTATNGGRPDPAAFEAPALGWGSVTRLFGAGTGDDYAIERVADMTQFFALPPATLPIGEDPGGNLILIGADGRISLFAFCGWPLTDLPASVPLAPGLDAFLGSLRPESAVPAWASDYAAVAAAGGHPEWRRDPPAGYSWHLDIPRATMQLVPRDIHWMAPHVSSTDRLDLRR